MTFLLALIWSMTTFTFRCWIVHLFPPYTKLMLIQQEESRHSAMVHSYFQDHSALVVAPTTWDTRPSPAQFSSEGTLVN